MRTLIGSSNSEYPVLFTSEQLKRKWRPGVQPWQVKKSSKLIFCAVYYLTVLVYTKTTSPQCQWLALDIYLAASRLGKYPPLATSTSVNSC